MKATQKLHDLGQSIWVDNISRGMINSGTLRRYIDELSVTGLTSNPTIFDHAVGKSADYDETIRRKVAQGLSGEKLFFELALEDLTQAAEWSRKMSSKYEVTGYDRKTGALMAFYDVPSERISLVKNIAGVPSSDDGLGSYPLNRGQVSAIAKLLDTAIDNHSIDFFLEAYDEGTDQPAAR